MWAIASNVALAGTESEIEMIIPQVCITGDTFTEGGGIEAKFRSPYQSFQEWQSVP